jgi:hypothetical protein
VKTRNLKSFNFIFTNLGKEFLWEELKPAGLNVCAAFADFYNIAKVAS